jgi:hypothetical protein
MYIGNPGIMIRQIPTGAKAGFICLAYIDVRTFHMEKPKGLVLLHDKGVPPFFILSSVVPETDTGQYHQAYRICG